MTFSERLKELRKSMHLSQQELADRLGVTKGLIGMYEIGRRNPSYEMEELLADFFNVSIDYLRGDENITMRFIDERHLMLIQEYDSQPDLQNIIMTYRSMNEDGQEALVSYCDYLSGQSKYKKCDIDEEMEG